MKNDGETERLKPTRRIAGVAALGLVTAVGWTLASGIKRPPERVVSPSKAIHLALPYRGVCRDLEVREKGRKVEFDMLDVKDGLARLSFQLPPGAHDLRIHFQGLVPGLTHDYAMQVVVDLAAPPLEAALSRGDAELRSRVTTDEQVKLSGRTEPLARLNLENTALQVEKDGRFETTVDLQPGWNHLLLTSMDEAGNRSKLTYSLFRDVKDPELTWQTIPDQVFDKKSARLEFDIADDGKIAGVSGKVDGDKPVTFYAKADGRWVGKTPELYEGYHQISVKAVDESGRTVASRRQVVIDSSEVLGDAALGLGARGEDVHLLQQRLAEAGYLTRDTLGDVFDGETEAAVKKFQAAEGFEVTGRAEGETLIALGPRIFINLSNFSLVLDRPGKEQKRWMIASGSYDHPTPVGHFRIVEKVLNPSWLPPKSDWAKDAKPVPPGPDNPLGTRWLGFDWGGVGIHGTNAPWTVGSAASHGCMRMVSGQVEELFDLVDVGTPVVVLGGWEDDPALEKYWPSKKPEDGIDSDKLART